MTTVLGTDAARDSDEQRSVTNLDPASSFVTITISREDAERWATGWSAHDDGASELNRMIAACRAALEEER